ncbi:MAG TPA: lipase maturation factor family protein, partial [Thermoanaerobaculia bacterium]|nr:lipase maturation factor family protein [Thermoanaerobaculia bacterium]
MFEEYGTHQPEADKLDVWFGPDVFSTESFLRARWLFLRCLGGVFFSAFYSLYFQIHGLIGPNGILPASSYLDLVHRLTGWRCYALVPTLLWINSGELALDLVVWLGLAASVAIMLNLWPRLSILIALLLFLSFVSAAQQFSGYQSDGMLLEAAFLSLFFAPPGLRPGLGAAHPPSRASLFMLRWEWFRIYFESGLVKLLSGETQWRDLSAMDRYYENGPLPSWIGWYVQHWPHGFHAVTCAATLIVELFVVWLVFLPKSSRRIAFLITTPLQIGIILTANYAFLNYLVLILGFLLLDDRVFERVRLRAPVRPKPEDLPPAGEPRVRYPRAAAAGVLITVFFATISSFVVPNVPVLNIPATVLAPFRIANSFGL